MTTTYVLYLWNEFSFTAKPQLIIKLNLCIYPSSLILFCLPKLWSPGSVSEGTTHKLKPRPFTTMHLCLPSLPSFSFCPCFHTLLLPTRLPYMPGSYLCSRNAFILWISVHVQSFLIFSLLETAQEDAFGFIPEYISQNFWRNGTWLFVELQLLFILLTCLIFLCSLQFLTYCHGCWSPATISTVGGMSFISGNLYSPGHCLLRNVARPI